MTPGRTSPHSLVNRVLYFSAHLVLFNAKIILLAFVSMIFFLLYFLYYYFFPLYFVIIFSAHFVLFNAKFFFVCFCKHYFFLLHFQSPSITLLPSFFLDLATLSPCQMPQTSILTSCLHFHITHLFPKFY